MNLTKFESHKLQDAKIVRDFSFKPTKRLDLQVELLHAVECHLSLARVQSKILGSFGYVQLTDMVATCFQFNSFCTIFHVNLLFLY